MWHLTNERLCNKGCGTELMMDWLGEMWPSSNGDWVGEGVAIDPWWTGVRGCGTELRRDCMGGSVALDQLWTR